MSRLQFIFILEWMFFFDLNSLSHSNAYLKMDQTNIYTHDTTSTTATQKITTLEKICQRNANVCSNETIYQSIIAENWISCHRSQSCHLNSHLLMRSHCSWHYVAVAMSKYKRVNSKPVKLKRNLTTYDCVHNISKNDKH